MKIEENKLESRRRMKGTGQRQINKKLEKKQLLIVWYLAYTMSELGGPILGTWKFKLA